MSFKHLPVSNCLGTGVTRACSHARLFTWVLDLNSGPDVCTASTLWTISLPSSAYHRFLSNLYQGSTGVRNYLPHVFHHTWECQEHVVLKIPSLDPPPVSLWDVVMWTGEAGAHSNSLPRKGRPHRCFRSWQAALARLLSWNWPQSPQLKHCAFRELHRKKQEPRSC